jgi:hypothetical protein
MCLGLGRACRGFRSAKWPSPTQPNPARPGPRAPGAPAHLPMRPLLLSLSHLDFPRSNLSLPLPPLSPRGALGFGVKIAGIWIPGGEFPPLLPLPLSLSFPSPSSPARPPLPVARAPRRAAPAPPPSRPRAPPGEPPPRRPIPAARALKGNQAYTYFLIDFGG